MKNLLIILLTVLALTGLALVLTSSSEAPEPESVLATPRSDVTANEPAPAAQPETTQRREIDLPSFDRTDVLPTVVPAPTNVVITGKVDVDASLAETARVRLSWMRAPPADAKAGAHTKWLRHVESYLHEPDFPNPRIYKRGIARTLDEHGEYRAEFAWAPAWESAWMRVEVWNAPNDDDGRILTGESTLLAFSRPFELQPGLNWQTEDLTATSVLRCIARLARPPEDSATTKATWTLVSEPSMTRESLGIEPVVMHGKWSAEGVLDLPLPSYYAGKPFKLAAHQGSVSVWSPALMLAAGLNDFGTLQLPPVSHIEGRVIDTRTKAGVGGQPVRLSAPGIVEVRQLGLRASPQRRVLSDTVTDADGRFFFHSIPAGTYEIQTEARPNASIAETNVRGRWIGGAEPVVMPVDLVAGETTKVEVEIGSGLIRLTANVEGIQAFPAFLTARYGFGGSRDMALLDAPEFTIDVASGEAVLLMATRSPRKDEAGPFVAAFATFAPDGGADTVITLRPFATRYTVELPPMHAEAASVAIRPVGSSGIIDGFTAPIDTYYVQMPGDGLARDVVGLPPGEYTFSVSTPHAGVHDWTALVQ